MSALHLITEVTVQASGDGLLEFTNTKANEVMTTLQLVSYVVATAFFLIRCTKGGWTVSGMVVNALIGGLLIWIVHHYTDVENRVDDEMNNASPSVVAVHAPPTTSQG